MKIRFASLVSLFLCVCAHAAVSQAEPACYKFASSEDPSGMAPIVNPQPEIWCYRPLEYPVGSLFIYNADSNRVKPELAMVVTPDGMITHASLAAGQLTVHRVLAAQFNPFSVPIAEPKDLTPTPLPQADSELMRTSGDEALKFLSSMAPSFESLAPEDLHGSSVARAEALPWRGFWWPYKNLPLATPLSKYDRFVRTRAGGSPGAAAWEENNHSYHGVWWEGHCNGWAASAILRAQPTVPRRDPDSGVTFTVSDMKGLLAEKDFCATASFFGQRYRGAGDDLYDVRPEVFHKTLVYYIGRLGKLVAMDYHRDAVVDNHIVSGYSMNMERTGEHSYMVTAVLYMHQYDKKASNEPGPAPSYKRTYRYSLQMDDSGRFTGGQWYSENPDFIWIPLSIADCSKNNPRVEENYVEQILNLPADY